MELQTHIAGLNNNTTTSNFEGVRRGDDNLWKVLWQFYSCRFSLGVQELFKKGFAENTAARCIKRLINFGFIELCYHHQGQTKRKKLYKITESGALAWEQHIDSV